MRVAFTKGPLGGTIQVNNNFGMCSFICLKKFLGVYVRYNCGFKAIKLLFQVLEEGPTYTLKYRC